MKQLGSAVWADCSKRGVLCNGHLVREAVHGTAAAEHHLQSTKEEGMPSSTFGPLDGSSTQGTAQWPAPVHTYSARTFWTTQMKLDTAYVF